MKADPGSGYICGNSEAFFGRLRDSDRIFTNLTFSL
jgi:hypothetical protein